MKAGVALEPVEQPDVIALIGELDAHLDGFAELKRMYVRPAARGHGIGALIVRFLERQAVERGYAIMRLETGVKQLLAISLYQGLGYVRRDPFAPYRPDPNSLFMEKIIRPPA